MKPLQFLCLILLAFTGHVCAVPIVSAGSGNWNNTSTWIGGVVPSAGDDVTISNGHTITITTNASCSSVTIGAIPFTSSSNLTLNAGISLTVSGDIIIEAPLFNSIDNRLNVDAGNVTCSSVSTVNSSTDSRRCLINISTGTLTCSNSILLANNTVRNKLVFSGAGILQIGGNTSTIDNAQFTAATGTIDFNSPSSQDILSLAYYNLKCSGGGVKQLTTNTTLAGSLQIDGAAQLDVTSTNHNLSIAGNFTVTSTHPDPFNERNGTVTFNGSNGVQNISTILSQETFYNLIINNTAGNSAADIIFNTNCYVSQSYTHTRGKVNLQGNDLTITSQNNTGNFVNCNLSGGSIISTVPGSDISFADYNDSTYVNFTGTTVGNSSVAVSLTINTGRINLEKLVLYGTGNFTKSFPLDDDISKGGNKFRGVVTFTAAATASRWRMSSGTGALPDSFFAKTTFFALANGATGGAGSSDNAFIVGANSTKNYFADTVLFNCNNTGGIFIGSSNGVASGTQSSHTFNGHVEVTLSANGNITFADGDATHISRVTFNRTIKFNSAAGSNGNIYVGKNISGSYIVISGSGRLIDGDITGGTNIYFYNVTQNNALPQAIDNPSTTNSKVIIGSITGQCTWNGALNIVAPYIDIAYSIFYNSCSFVLNGNGAPVDYTGGNVFSGNSTTYFFNLGKRDWKIACIAPDDYNGNVYYGNISTGGLYPAYNTNCTYAGNISISSPSDTVVFAVGANGRVTMNGNLSAYFTNISVKPSSIKRLTIDKTAGNVILNHNIYISANGNLTLLSGKIISTATAMPVLMDETATVTATTSASSSFVDGPMRIDVSSNSLQSLHFPIGKAGICRPADLKIQHTNNTSYSYKAEVTNSSAHALNWAKPTGVQNVSSVRYWDIDRTVTATGAAASSAGLSTSPLPEITLYYGIDDIVLSTADVTIVKNTALAPTSWIDIGGDGTAIPSGSITSTSAPSVFNSFSRFTLGSYFYYITTWTGAVNDSWTNVGNWDNVVPTYQHTAVIPDVATQPLIISNQSVKNIYVDSNATVNVSVGNNLSVSDSLYNDGDFIGTGNVLLNGNTSQGIAGTGSYYSLSLNNNAGAIIGNSAGNMVTITERYTPVSGILTTNDRLTLLSNSSGTAIIATGPASGNYISGKVNLQRYIPGRRAWRLINFPITAAGAPTINEALQEGVGGNASSNPNPGYGTHITGGSIANGFDQNQVNNASMKEWIGGAWANISSTNAAVSNISPYFLFVRGSRANNLGLLTNAPADNTTLRIIAGVKQGNQSVSLSGSGWKLVGNPFPSRLNLDAMAAGNSSLINKNFTFWDPKLGGTNNVGGYVTASFNGLSYDYSPAPVSDISQYAQPFTAFFVDAISAGTLSVTEANKCTCGTDNVFRPMPLSTEPKKLSINMRSHNNDGSTPTVDAVLVTFSSNYSNSIDQYDAANITNIGSENLSMQRAGTKLAIERRNVTIDADTIHLDMSSLRVRDYHFEFVPVNFEGTALTAFIEDSYTGSQTPIDLAAGSNYQFSITNNPAAYAGNRFRLIIKSNLVVLPVVISEIKTKQYKNNNHKTAIQVGWKVEQQADISNYDIERSADGINFNAIGSATATNSAVATYLLNDENPITGNNWYRIKANKTNGNFIYSSILRENVLNKGSIRLIQNPVINNTLITGFSSIEAGKYNIAVIDEAGKQITSLLFNHNGTDGTKSIHLNKYLTRGIYKVTVSNDNETKGTLTIMIQ